MAKTGTEQIRCEAKMTKTLDEFVESYPAVNFLKENLQANLDVYFPDMDEEEQEQFMRMNLIMIRQCLNSFGVK